MDGDSVAISHYLTVKSSPACVDNSAPARKCCRPFFVGVPTGLSLFAAQTAAAGFLSEYGQKGEGVRDLPCSPSHCAEEATSRSLFRRERFETPIDLYCSSVRTVLGFWLACASIAVLDCIRIAFFV